MSTYSWQDQQTIMVAPVSSSITYNIQLSQLEMRVHAKDNLVRVVDIRPTVANSICPRTVDGHRLHV